MHDVLQAERYKVDSPTNIEFIPSPKLGNTLVFHELQKIQFFDLMFIGMHELYCIFVQFPVNLILG